MKLVINPGDGTITVDTPDNVSAAQFVRELMTGTAAPPPPQAIESKRVKSPPVKRRRKRKLAPPKADRPLTKALDETWAWMAAADHEDGITPDELAQAYGISHAGGMWRIKQLMDRDMAWRVSPGRYRVGSASDLASLNGIPR